MNPMTQDTIRRGSVGTTRNKFGNVPTMVDNIRFASKAEAKRYQELRLLERAGEVWNLELQPRYPLQIGGALICTYIADFYYEGRKGSVVEDVKGVQTPEFKIKRKLFELLNGIPITIISKGR